MPGPGAQAVVRVGARPAAATLGIAQRKHVVDVPAQRVAGRRPGQPRGGGVEDLDPAVLVGNHQAIRQVVRDDQAGEGVGPAGHVPGVGRAGDGLAPAGRVPRGTAARAVAARTIAADPARRARHDLIRSVCPPPGLACRGSGLSAGPLPSARTSVRNAVRL